MSLNVAPIQQRRLRRFVDRDAEMGVFRAMLDQTPADQPVTVVWGDGGMGKSSLLDRMEEECSLRGMAQAKVIWSETRNHDYLGVMRKIKNDVGADRFSGFNDLVNFFTVPQYKLELVVTGALSVADNLQNQGTIGSIAGVVVQDANFAVPRADLGIPEAERMNRLTDVFLQELNAAAAARDTIVFLDAFEKASTITHSWVSNELVGALFDGRLSELRIVLCGRLRPNWEDDHWLIANEMHLTPLGRDHVIEYIDKSHLNIPHEAIAYVADALLATTNGVPSSLANAVSMVAKQWQLRAA
jgi:GTPase SAR1 family protein